MERGRLVPAVSVGHAATGSQNYRNRRLQQSHQKKIIKKKELAPWTKRCSISMLLLLSLLLALVAVVFDTDVFV